MRSTKEIVIYIEEKKVDIINRLNAESIVVYQFLQKEFSKGDITNNPLFQFVFRSYYRLDNAGLSNEFKAEYFKIMEEYRHLKNIDIDVIVNRLYKFKRAKGDNSVQFSFATKLIHTIDHNYPIYDSEVARVFGFSTYYLKDKARKLERFIKWHNYIKETYHEILSKKTLEHTMQLFDEKYPNNDLSNTMKIDFIFWTTGKLMK